jgi:hypothetical protein
MMMDKLITCFILISILAILAGCLEDKKEQNAKPLVSIVYPYNGSRVSSLVMISGTSYDPDGDLILVEIKVGEGEWEVANGVAKWSYDWSTYEYEDGFYTISARSWDGKVYSEIASITVEVDNPEIVETDSHKWAVFIAAANFPKNNESKLGNGGLYLAEDMAAYFIEKCDFATSNIFILFDDGWIRKDNGYGERLQTLQERHHEYDITYGGATKKNVVKTLNHIINESNRYRDSEVFIWIFNHGYGDLNNSLTGGKLFESSQIFLWDDIINDRDLGDMLLTLKSTKVCIIIDACFSGGFADKTIYNIPTSPLLKSGVPQSGRIVITGTSKFRKGYASTLRGPIFSQLWFEGLSTGKADGFKPGLFRMGRKGLLKDGKVSVEEAFYYARYKLRTDEDLREFRFMEPQISDRYPSQGFILSIDEMFL